MNPDFKALLLFAAILLAGCAGVVGPNAQSPDADTIRPVPRPGNDQDVPPQTATTAQQFDTTTQAERAAASVPGNVAATERRLGRTIASLGNPAAAGFWLETPLVTVKTRGRVGYPETGKTVAVDLIPIAGPASGGSRISLPAMRLLGAPLTALAELVVFAR